VLITKLKINALITTLALQSVYHGLVYIVSGGMSIMVSKPIFSVIGTTRLFGQLPVPIIILAALYVLFFFILKHTVFGRSIYCIGGNPEAARISGLNVDKITIIVYTLSSLMAVIAGIVLTSRMGGAQVTAAGTYALDSVAAVVLGGIVLTGGKGSIWGTLLGISIMGVMQKGLIMIQMPIFYQYVATGIVLIIAVFAQNINTIRLKG
jgi:ribose/xylose/arabinose/galactoside ABC-type transport system permease subunit